MLVAKEFSQLTGAEKNAAVTSAIETWVKSLDGVSAETSVVIMALIPVLVPNLIRLNYYIDTTAEVLFVKAKTKCSALSCFKSTSA